MRLKQHLRLYQHLVRINLIHEFQYHLNFWLDNLVTIIWASLGVLYFFVIYSYVSQVKGWSLGQVLILSGFYMIFNSIFKSLVEGNFSQFARIIYRGELDYILLKPVDSQFLLSFSRFSLRSFLRLIGGLAILAWGLRLTAVPVTLTGGLVALLGLVLGFAAVYSLWFMTLLLAFRVGNVENLYFLFMPFFQISRLPIDIMPRPVDLIFSYLVPLVFVATVPAQALSGIFPAQVFLFGGIIALSLVWFSHQLWLLALRSYTSASS